MQNSPFMPLLFAVFCGAAASGFACWQRRLQHCPPLPKSDSASERQPDRSEFQQTDASGRSPVSIDTKRLLSAITLVLAHTSVVFVAPWAVLTTTVVDKTFRHQAAGCIGMFVAMLVVGVVYSRGRAWS